MAISPIDAASVWGNLEDAINRHNSRVQNDINLNGLADDYVGYAKPIITDTGAAISNNGGYQSNAEFKLALYDSIIKNVIKKVNADGKVIFPDNTTIIYLPGSMPKYVMANGDEQTISSFLYNTDGSSALTEILNKLEGTQQ